MRYSFIIIFLVFFSTTVFAQVVWTEPAFPTQGDDIVLYFDATQGNAGLADFAGDVYAHMGLITSASNGPTDWQYVQGTWGTEDAKVLMSREGPDLYSKSYNIADFHGLPTGELVEQLAFVFRSGNGSQAGRATDGSDIYLEVFPPGNELFVSLLSPEENTIIYVDEELEVELLINREANVEITDNNGVVFSGQTDVVSLNLSDLEAGAHKLHILIEDDGETQELSRSFFVLERDEERAERPMWMSAYGLSYGAGAGVYGISLVAPDKENVFLLCPANEFKVDLDYRMTKTIDGTSFWIEVERGNFENGQNLYQFLVDGETKIADPYSKVVLDPGNDSAVSSEVRDLYPEYPEELTTGIITSFELDHEIYDWEIENFQRPKKEKLVIYELMMRDFLEDKSYASLLDTISYLAALGVNAIELMPVQEFEGNNSWGYNPSYHNAVDKYYGSKKQLQAVIDHCHKEGIAVIFDVVFNHAFSQSPLCQLYWDPALFRPAPNNPWLNETARHPFNVGYDFNHESQYTIDWVQEILRNLIEEFKVDGFRFDLSKGFTQVNSAGNPNLMAQYDQSRIDILDRYADFIWQYGDDLYVIMEHFAEASEEKVLAEKGMLLWSNTTFQFAEAGMGYSSDLSAASYKSRGFPSPAVIAYMESHDEERLGYKIKTWGNGNSAYNTKAPWTFSERIVATASVYFSIPGPKMLWQFGELGYDFSINRCEDGSINENCRLSPKPVRWDYLQETFRTNIYDKFSALLYLRNEYEVFHTPNFSLTDDPYFKRIKLNGQEMNAVTLANFDINAMTVVPQFQHTGTWYEYFTGEEISVTDVNAAMEFEPGEYRIYTSQKITPPGGFFSNTSGLLVDLVSLSPNPAIAGGELMLNAQNVIQSVYLSDVKGVIQELEVECLTREYCKVDLPSRLSEGLYFVYIENKAGRQVSQIFIQGN